MRVLVGDEYADARAAANEMSTAIRTRMDSKICQEPGLGLRIRGTRGSVLDQRERKRMLI